MPKSVLIVEDYADVRMIMKILIHRYGYEVIEAADGYEALEKAIQHRPDLILMDLAMPLVDGFTAVRMIRNFEGFQEVPIIAISAYGNIYSEKALKAGCNEVINKPLDLSALEPLLNQYAPQ